MFAIYTVQGFVFADVPSKFGILMTELFLNSLFVCEYPASIGALWKASYRLGETLYINVSGLYITSNNCTRLQNSSGNHLSFPRHLA